VLEQANERANEQAPIGQADDGIGDQLAGAVVGDLPATLDADYFDAAGGEFSRRRANVRGIGLAAKREHRFVFDQQELIRDRAGGTLRYEFVLQVPCLAVVKPAQPAHRELHARHDSSWSVANL
jgi:hypothetical protein